MVFLVVVGVCQVAGFFDVGLVFFGCDFFFRRPLAALVVEGVPACDALYPASVAARRMTVRMAAASVSKPSCVRR